MRIKTLQGIEWLLSAIIPVWSHGAKMQQSARYAGETATRASRASHMRGIKFDCPGAIK